MVGFLSPSMPEMMIVGVIALLLFGKRLPEVARSLGKGMREFKEGMAGVTGEFNSAYNAPTRVENRSSSRPVPDDEEDRGELIAPKFEPPPVAPSEPHQPA